MGAWVSGCSGGMCTRARACLNKVVGRDHDLQVGVGMGMGAARV